MARAILSSLVVFVMSGCYVGYEYVCDPYDRNYSHTEYECWTEIYEVEVCNRRWCWVEEKEEYVCEDIHICYN